MRSTMLLAATIPLAFGAAAQMPPKADVNAAHRGGGVILEGAPGDPAPPVIQTPPLANASPGSGLVVLVPPQQTTTFVAPPSSSWTPR